MNKETVDKIISLLGFPAGILFGLAISLWQYYSAKAAVKVRPNLADVGLVDAVLTSHGTDWMFYHQPIISGMVVTAFTTSVIGLFWFGKTKVSI